MSSFSQILVDADKAMDYIPIVSAINNTINIVIKIVLNIFFCVIPGLYAKVRDNVWVKHLFEEKGLCACIFLTIPFLNILVASCRDNPQAVAAALQPAPDPVVKAFERAHEEMERGNVETLKQVAQTKADARLKIESDHAKAKEDHAKQIARYKEFLAKCDDTDIGKARRQLLMTTIDSCEKSFASYMSASIGVQTANGF